MVWSWREGTWIKLDEDGNMIDKIHFNLYFTLFLILIVPVLLLIGSI